MAEGVLIRAALPEDADGFARIAADESVFGNLLRLPYPTPAQYRGWLEGVAMDEVLLVAERDGELLGFAGLMIAMPSPRRRHARTLLIAVAQPVQEQGVGSLLMQALLDHADRWLGVLRIELGVFVGNAPAYRLYQKFGFVEEGVQRAYAFRDGRYQDVIQMARLSPRLLQQQVI